MAQDSAQALQDILIDVEALKDSMERVMAGTTPDHAKWGCFKQCAQEHHDIAVRYSQVTGENVRCYDYTRMGSWADTLWPTQKEIFDGVYAKLRALQGKLTKRGPQMSSVGFDELLHPAIRAAAIRHYQAEDFRNAVLDAAIAVFDLLRDRTGLDLDGDNLCNRAFSPERPMLIFSNTETDSGRNDQRGFMDIFKGFYRGIRNPKAHSLVHDLDAVKAGQYLVLASLLARRIDEAQFEPLAAR